MVIIVVFNFSRLLKVFMIQKIRIKISMILKVKIKIYFL